MSYPKFGKKLNEFFALCALLVSANYSKLGLRSHSNCINRGATLLRYFFAKVWTKSYLVREMSHSSALINW